MANFTIDHEILNHAEVASVSKRNMMAFSSVRFFTEKFPCLVHIKDIETTHEAMDILQDQFHACVINVFEDLHLTTSMQIDELWFAIAVCTDCMGQLKYDRLTFFFI